MTVIEILVVVGVIAILVGLLLPAVRTVQRMAKETKQKAQFTAIELGLAAFKNDHGDYPPSHWWDSRPNAPPPNRQDYCGAQKLAEALLGWDLLGFHPQSAWQADGLDLQRNPNTVYHTPDSLQKRRGRYLELETANAFQLGETVPGLADGLYTITSPLAPQTYVLCDVFGVNERKIRMSDGKMVTPGTPILYYRANPASMLHEPPQQDLTILSIYDARDNAPILGLGRLADTTKPPASRRLHPLAAGVQTPSFEYFYEYIRDPRVQARPWPSRPDSYLLISAGMDGLFGTDDDIRNFGP
jgi:type II secretory pathway pseudopilin PulG